MAQSEKCSTANSYAQFEVCEVFPWGGALLTKCPEISQEPPGCGCCSSEPTASISGTVASFPIRHLLRAGRVNAQPDLAYIFAGELQLQTARGRIAFRRSCYVHRCRQGLQQELPLPSYQKTFCLAE